MKKLFLLFSCLFIAACASTTVQTSDYTGYSAPDSRDIRYRETHRKADEAFRELDYYTDEKPRKFRKPKENIVKIPASEQPPLNYEEPILREKPRPGYVAEKPRPVNPTIFPIVNGFPIWVNNPNVAGYKYSAYGSAPVQENGDFYIQKKIAKTNAIGEITKIVNVSIYNEINSYVVSDGKGGENIEFDSYSRHRAEELLKTVTEIDQWTDPETGVFYILVGIKG